MLSELNVRNFAVLEDVQLKFGSGMTILSGAEGVGKSLIVDAMSILLGAKAPSGLIRSGATTARVEGVFWLSAEDIRRMNVVIQDSAIEIEDDGMLVICRELQEQGRSVARVNSRTVPVSLVRQIAQYLVDVHSQMENLSIVDSKRQLELLDVHGNLIEMRQQVAESVDALRRKTAELTTMNEGKQAERQELLKYQVEEIERAHLKIGEDESLKNEREILYRADALKEGCLKIYGNLYGDDLSATELIDQALVSLRGLGSIDASFASHSERLEDVMANLEDIAREINVYMEAVESSADKLEEVEHRLDTISSLKRKYGPSIEEILDYMNKSRAEVNDFETHQERQKRLEGEKDYLVKETGKLSEELSLLRQKAAKSLARLVNDELADLGLPWAKFSIHMYRHEDVDGVPATDKKHYAFTREGIDRVEFQVITNPGEPMRPLSMIASGGETCRIILALKSALKRADPVPTLVFDEIDIGVGGRSADTVGMKLATLAQYHQVLCITHLPQIACFGDAHLRLMKDASSGRSTTSAENIHGQERIDELAAMLGANGEEKLMHDGAMDLLARAESWKKDKAMAK